MAILGMGHDSQSAAARTASSCGSWRSPTSLLLFGTPIRRPGRTWSFAGGLAMSADNPPLRDEDIATSQGGSTGPQSGDTIDGTDRAGGDADRPDRADGVDGTDVSDSGSGGDDADGTDADGTDADGTDADGSDADGTDVSDSGLGGDADGTDR